MTLTVNKIFYFSTLLSILAVSGCDSSSSSTATVTALDTTVVPSLGLMSNTEVQFFQADKRYFNPRVGSYTGLSGIVEATVPSSHTGPLLITATPGSEAYYFDESTRAFESNANSALPTLSVYLPEHQENVAVTPLTTIAAKLLDELKADEESVTADEVTNMNKAVATAFGLGSLDITLPPTLVRSEDEINTLGNTSAEIYAASLAALAEMGAGESRPMVAVLNDMLADLTNKDEDDNLDGKLDAESGTSAVVTTYADFRSNFAENFDIVKANRLAPQFSFSLGIIDPDIQSIYKTLKSGTVTEEEETEEPINATRNAGQCFNADLFKNGTETDLTYTEGSKTIRYNLEVTSSTGADPAVVSGQSTETGGTQEIQSTFESTYSIDSTDKILTYFGYSKNSTAPSGILEKVEYEPKDNNDLDEGFIVQFDMDPADTLDQYYQTFKTDISNGVAATNPVETSGVTTTYVGDQDLVISSKKLKACRFESLESVTTSTATFSRTFIEWYGVDTGILLKRTVDGEVVKLLTEGSLDGVDLLAD